MDPQRSQLSSKQEPGWYNQQKDSTRGARAQSRLENNNNTTLFNTEQDGFLSELAQIQSNNPSTTTSSTSILSQLPRSNTQTNQFYSSGASPTTPTPLDRQNDNYFDSEGRFNPIKQTPKDRNQPTNNPYSDSSLNTTKLTGPQRFKRKEIKTLDNSINQTNNPTMATAAALNAKLQSQLDINNHPDDADCSDNEHMIYHNNKNKHSPPPHSNKQSTIPFENKLQNRILDAEEERFQQELADDTSLWAQKERLRKITLEEAQKKDPSQFTPDELADKIAPHDTKGKRLFRKFDTTKGVHDPEELGSLYSIDADGLPTTAMSYGRWVGVPNQNLVNSAALSNNQLPNQTQQPLQQVAKPKLIRGQGLKSKLPTNVTKDGRKFTVEPPVAISPEDYAKLSQEQQNNYQEQLLDYQKFSFRQMNNKQRELMLLAQWDKLTPEQQDECREFQYLHLNFNTRKRVKHMMGSEREEFLRLKHFDQQRLFLQQPLSFELGSPDEQLGQFVQDDDESDYYLESLPKKTGKYSEYIRSNNDNDDDSEQEPIQGTEDDPDGLAAAVRKLKSNDEGEKYDKDGKRIVSWTDVVHKYTQSGGDPYISSQPSQEEMELIKEQLRNLTPQQQFNILFRQHEKQLQELERFHNAQIRKATDLKMKFYHEQHAKSGSKKPLDTKELINQLTKDKSMIKLRYQQEAQRQKLLKKQEQEHQQLTNVLLVQEKARQEQEKNLNKLATLRQKSKMPSDPNQPTSPLDDDLVHAEEDEIDNQLRLLQQYQPTFKSTGRPLQDEIAQKKKELLWRKQEEELLRAQRQESLEMAQMTQDELDGRNRDRVVALLEQTKDKRQREYKYIKLRGKMIDLKMPITTTLYRPYHPYMSETTRHRDQRAAYIHKTLGMLLFGVNVRWRGGIMNGLLSTMVPPGEIPASPNDPVQRGFYVDIEHRHLDFTNLYNYYGVAAALYNPSIMPSFSHALYEDPSLDPLTNPNVIGFDHYEEQFKNYKRFNNIDANSNNTNNDNQSDLVNSATGPPLPPQSSTSSPQPNNSTDNNSTSNNHQTFTPEQIEEIQQMKLREYQQNMSKTQTMSSNTRPLHSLRPSPTSQTNIIDPFPSNNDTNSQSNNNSNNYMDDWLQTVLNQNDVVEQRKKEIQYILPDVRYIDENMSPDSKFAQFQAELIQTMDTNGDNPNDIYNQLVYNTNLSLEQKQHLFNALEEHQRTRLSQSDNASGSTGNIITGGDPHNAISPHQIRARKENILGRTLIDKDLSNNNVFSFNKAPIPTSDEVSRLDAKALEQAGFSHPIFTKALDMQSQQIRQKELRSQYHQAGNDNRGRSGPTYNNLTDYTDNDDDNGENDFLQNHIHWDYSSDDGNHYNGKQRFNKQDHRVQNNPRTQMPQWSRSSDENNNNNNNNDMERVSNKKLSNKSQQLDYWSSQTQQQYNNRLTQNSQTDTSGYHDAKKQLSRNPASNPNLTTLTTNINHEQSSSALQFNPPQIQELPSTLTHTSLKPEALLAKHGINVQPPTPEANTTDTKKGFFSGWW